ncbi:flagellar export chaperone FliS [Craterilacuibacter sp.]|uniref:flagellar export chaperone FliS n=1 Tax=Craterilacuibacter sp. TaxID=2870909 RepID=UPI003F38802D
MNIRRMQQAYGSSALETEVEVASPHKLVLMLFDGALQAIRLARVQMEQGKIAEKGQLIGKAVSIIDEGLRNSLDAKQGGELAVNLASLYEYCTGRLLQANLNNDAAALDEVSALLGEVRSAWVEIGRKPAAATGEMAHAGV